MEFLSSLEPIQWIFLAIGLFVVGQPLVASLVEKMREPAVDDDYRPEPIFEEDRELTAVVRKWECLADACAELGLDEAYDKLEEVFPLLIKVREDDDEGFGVEF